MTTSLCRPLAVSSRLIPASLTAAVLFSLSSLVSQGCAQFDSSEPLTESETTAVKNGSSVLGNDFTGTARLTITRPADDDIPCSGSLIAQNLVLTSAACLVDAVDNGTLVGTITVGFGADGGEPVNGISGTAVEFHRYFNEDSIAAFQLAIITLATDAPVAFEPVTLNDQPLPETLPGQVTLVGYGETEEDIGLGSRRALETSANAITEDFFLAGDSDNTTCRGDGGGPVFADLGSGVVQIGMTNGTTSCSERTQRTRIDRHTKDFIFRYIDRFNGACIAGDTCITAGCRSPDPDCSPCEWGNTCATVADNCPTSDWDCPLGSFVGDECAESLDCEENGRCLMATDDDTFEYCTRPCTPGVASSCPTNMTCETDGDGGNECVFGTPSPGSQGFSCSAGTECRSGICEDLICVNTCTVGAADACPGDFTCGPSKEQPGTNVCLGEDFSGGGGFCSTSSGGSGAAGLLVLLALIGIRRRK